MKKKLMVFLVALLAFVPFLVSAKADKVPIYLFYGNTCPHCHEFLEYVAGDLSKEYGDKFELKAFEVWQNSNNGELMMAVGEVLELGDDELGGVPFFVIGDDHFVGYASQMNGEITAKIDEEYTSSKRYDAVGTAINTKNLDSTKYKQETLEEALKTSGLDAEISDPTKKTSSGTSSVSVIVWNLVFVVIASAVILIYINIKFSDLELKLDNLSNVEPVSETKTVKSRTKKTK